MSPLELEIVSKLIDVAREKDYTITVYDGEEYCLKRETDKAVILAALCSTESDTLVLRAADHGQRIGSIMLIWGNEQDLISDHSDNALTNEVVARTMMEFEGSEG